MAGGGNGRKDMVVLPYKDRLLLLSRYLQQLVMESLGKRLNLNGERVDQGIAVYGNKGSTDQHAYVQQLREGVNNFFVTFIEVLKDRAGDALEVEPLARFLLQQAERRVEAHRLVVRPLGHQRVEVVDHRQDARPERDLFALEPRRVALAVPALVVVADPGADHVDVRQVADDPPVYPPARGHDDRLCPDPMDFPTSRVCHYDAIGISGLATVFHSNGGRG